MPCHSRNFTLMLLYTANKKNKPFHVNFWICCDFTNFRLFHVILFNHERDTSGKCKNDHLTRASVITINK